MDLIQFEKLPVMGILRDITEDMLPCLVETI